MEVETLTPTLTEGLSEGTESQATDPTAQAVGQPQNVNPTQVESQGTQATSQDETRHVEPSEFYKSRREIRQLRETVARFEQALSKLQIPNPVSPQSQTQASPDDFWKQFGQDPNGVLSR